MPRGKTVKIGFSQSIGMVDSYKESNWHFAAGDSSPPKMPVIVDVGSRVGKSTPVWRLIVRRVSFLVAIGICVAAIAGCSSWGGNRTDSINQYSKDYQDRSIVAPGMGLDNNLNPSPMQKVGSAVAAVPSEVGSSMKTGAVTVAGWFSSSSAADNSSSSDASGSTSIFSRQKEATPELRLATAHMYERSNNFGAAEEQYEKALKQKPNDVSIILSYAHLMDHEGKLTEAQKLYERAIKANPREPAAYNDLGLCLARRGLVGNATKAISHAVELQPDRALYRNNLAGLLVEQNRYDDALTQLMAVNNEAAARYNLGVLLERQKQPELAGEQFHRALELNPSLVEARQWTERMAAQNPGMSNVAMYQRLTPAPARLAALPAPTVRDGSYQPAAETAPPVNVSRPAMSPMPSIAPAGTGPSYVASPATAPQGMPPTPESLRNYQPALGGELHFLPPTE
jgi:Tfp pilus assembly protein PilF